MCYSYMIIIYNHYVYYLYALVTGFVDELIDLHDSLLNNAGKEQL